MTDFTDNQRNICISGRTEMRRKLARVSVAQVSLVRRSSYVVQPRFYRAITNTLARSRASCGARATTKLKSPSTSRLRTWASTTSTVRAFTYAPRLIRRSISRFSAVYLVHWPVHLNPKGNHPNFPTLPDGTRDIIHDWPISKTWEQMEAVLKKGTLPSPRIPPAPRN